MRVAFVGLGAMGSAMARKLLDAGHELIVYNRTRSRADQLASSGARIAENPGQAAADCDAVITMLADDSALESTVFNHNGILHSLAPGKVHISCGTISVALSRRLASAHRERRQDYIAAPVFGRPKAAAVAKLFIVAAGSQDQIGKCEPLFHVMGQKTFVLGDDAPAANVVKLAGNFLISAVIESLAEAFALARKSGVGPTRSLRF